MKNRTGRIIYIAVFLMMVLVPLLMTNKRTDVRSAIDNRYLVELPAIDDADFKSGIEQYLCDRIGFRYQMNTCYQLLMDKVTGNLEHPSYTYGQDGYVFFKMHNNIKFEDYHRVFCDAVIKMKDYCETRGAKFYFMLNPEKLSVYRRYLPVGVNYNDDWVDELIDTLESEGVTCICTKDLLLERSYDEKVFNRQYDAGHWNDLGCFYATNYLWETIHKDIPGITAYTEDEFDIELLDAKYLPLSRFPIDEKIPSFQIKTKWENITSRFKGIRLHPDHKFFQYYVNKSVSGINYPKMLVFHGSYYNRGPQFFVGRASEYIGVHDYQNVLNLDYYFSAFQPEVVLFEAAEYVFNDSFFDSGLMSVLDYNPGLQEGQHSISEAIEKAREEAENIAIPDSVRLSVIAGRGMDSVYLDYDLKDPRYVYLFTDNRIFDLKKDAYGLFSADVPHNEIGSEATVYFVGNDGSSHYSDLLTERAYKITSDMMIFSPGAKYSIPHGWIEYETNM